MSSRQKVSDPGLEAHLLDYPDGADDLPPGFVLESTAGNDDLPPGFVLERGTSPPPRPSFTQRLTKVAPEIAYNWTVGPFIDAGRLLKEGRTTEQAKAFETATPEQRAIAKESGKALTSPFAQPTEELEPAQSTLLSLGLIGLGGNRGGMRGAPKTPPLTSVFRRKTPPPAPQATPAEAVAPPLEAVAPPPAVPPAGATGPSPVSPISTIKGPTIQEPTTSVTAPRETLKVPLVKPREVKAAAPIETEVPFTSQIDTGVVPAAALRPLVEPTPVSQTLGVPLVKPAKGKVKTVAPVESVPPAVVTRMTAIQSDASRASGQPYGRQYGSVETEMGGQSRPELPLQGTKQLSDDIALRPEFKALGLALKKANRAYELKKAGKISDAEYNAVKKRYDDAWEAYSKPDLKPSGVPSGTAKQPLLQGGAGSGAEEIAAGEAAAGYSPLIQPRLRTKITKESIGAVTDFMKNEGITVDPEGPRLFMQLAEHIGGAKDRLPRLVQLFEQRGLNFERDLKAALNESATESGRVLQIYSQAAKALDTGAQTPAKVRLRDMFYEAWLNGLVSAPASQVANIIGNTLTKLTLIGERGIAAGLDLATSKLTGTPRTRFLGDVKADVYGSIQGIKLGLSRAVRAFREQGAEGLSKVEYAPAIPGRAGTVIRTPTRALGASDAFFKSIAEQAELSVLAFRKAKSEGLRGTNLTQRIAELTTNPPKEWAKQIIQYGEYATFNNPLGKLSQSLMEARNHHLLAKMIAPFMRTPINIAKFTLARTPAGTAYTAYQIAKGALKGGEAIDATARGVMGSMISAGTVLLAAEGYITGGGPASPQVKNLLRETGWQPYSFTDGKTYIPFNRLEPISSIVGMAADFVEAFDEKKPQKTIDLATKISASVSENLTNKTFLVGIENAFQAFTDPKRFFERWAKGMTGTLVPNIVGATARAVDPAMRETSVATSPISKLPFLSKRLPAKQSVFGEEIIRPGTAAERLLSPIVHSTTRADRAVEAEAARLGMALRSPREEVSLGRGATVSRTTEEQRVFQRQSGQMSKQLLRDVLSWNGYNTLSDDMKRDIFSRVISRARETVKGQQIPEAAQTLFGNSRATTQGREE